MAGGTEGGNEILNILVVDFSSFVAQIIERHFPKARHQKGDIGFFGSLIFGLECQTAFRENARGWPSRPLCVLDPVTDFVV